MTRPERGRQELAVECDPAEFELEGARSFRVDVEREAHDHDVGVDRAGGGRVRRRHAGAQAVRALGNRSWRARGVFRWSCGRSFRSAAFRTARTATKAIAPSRRPCTGVRSTPGDTRATSSSTDESRSTKHEHTRRPQRLDSKVSGIERRHDVRTTSVALRARRS